FTRKSRKFSTYKGKIGKITKNLINRRFYTNVPLQKITTDTTEFKYYVLDSDGRINIKKAYLYYFLDMFNYSFVSYCLSYKTYVKYIMNIIKIYLMMKYYPIGCTKNQKPKRLSMH